MSSDFLEDVEHEDKSVLLTMRASGFAELTVLEGDGDDDPLASFPLMPDKSGLENAKKIADALNAWSEHIQQVGLVQE
jgi:hypothetical protein